MWLLSNKTKIADSGIMENLIDCHCHLLPGVDDGVKEMHESLEILNIWSTMGVKGVWLTPHVMEDIPNTTSHLLETFSLLKSRYNGKLSISLASENMLDNLLHERLATNDVLSLGNKSMHLLVETSYYNPPMDLKGMIDKVKRHGYVPILAHPERYQYMDISDYRKWKNEGVAFQMNIASLSGAYGLAEKKKAEMMLDKGMYDLCGTDTHSMRFVTYLLGSKIRSSHAKKIRQIIEKQNTAYDL